VQSAGIVLILCGAFLIYEVLHSRLRSLSGSGGSSSGGGGGGSNSGGGGGSSGDIGVHQGIDLTGAATGAVGSVYTIYSDYGSMGGQQQDDANAYAHQIGNVDA
jgi:hypothetical protein